MPARDPTTATSALSEEHSENIRCFLVADCSAIVSILCTKTLSPLNIFAKRSPQCWPAIRRSDILENPSETSATARASIKCAYGQSSGQRALAAITNSLHARSCHLEELWRGDSQSNVLQRFRNRLLCRQIIPDRIPQWCSWKQKRCKLLRHVR